MNAEWICVKPSLLNERPCNHTNYSDPCTACGGTRYLSELLKFGNGLKKENQERKAVFYGIAEQH